MPTAMVTGAGRGLGKALSQDLLARGWSVIGLVRSEESARQLEYELAGSLQTIITDIGHDDCITAISDGLASVDAVDLLVNNAGIVRRGPKLATAKPADIIDSVNVHCVGALRVTQAVLPWLLRSDRPQIVNISSRRGSLSQEENGGVAGSEVSYAYRIAKAAQNMLTVCLNHELAAEGVTVVAVHPGALRTDEAPPDADLSPDQAAARIVDLVEEPRQLDGLFLEPPGKMLAW